MRSATCPSVLEGKSLQQIQRRIGALKRLQNKLQLPPLSEFEAFGRTYPLPLKACQPEMAEVPAERLQYLAGFFDGDGCVSSHRMRPTMTVGVSGCSAEMLILFRDVFGGGIYNLGRGRGLKKPSLQWLLSSVRPCLSLNKLRNYAVVKQAELDLALSWPSDLEKRILASQRLSGLKSCDFDELPSISWAWLAGFVDAEGSIQIRADRKVISLTISQKRRKVLDTIFEFLQANCLRSGEVRSDSRSAYHLEVSAQKDVMILLEHLLEHGLLLKRDQAETALQVHELSHEELRHRISASAGNQMRYTRLDSDGCRRARNIGALSAKIRHSNHRFPEQEQQLSVLREEHEYQNSITVYSTLRSDTKLLIAQGAQQKPAGREDRVRIPHGCVTVYDNLNAITAAKLGLISRS